MTPEVEQIRDILQKFQRNFQSPQAGMPALPERFTEADIDRLSKYYELALKWNKRLHLTTLTRPREFFERHILESAFSASLIPPSVNQVWDLGSGMGVPGMVIAILRPDLGAHLVEASRNKTLFLKETAADLNLKNVKVVESRFQAIEGLPYESCLTVRAIEKMEKMIPEILRLGARSSQILIFGAKSLEEKARALIYINDKRKIESSLIPGSNRRYLINIIRST
jgi:16S rRNA (guanine(527)-N(7))-methyltransferase RsmG